MLKPALGLLVLALGLAVSAPASAASADSPAVPAGISSGVNDFSFTSFSADYYLGLDSHGRSTLKTVETLVADFPEIDQNHGILRALVKDYDGHPTDLTVVSVTDENGRARPFREANDDEASDDDGDFYQLVSRSGDFVHGSQTYVITYTQHNVTRFASGTGREEFYWDTNGTGWDQTFGSVEARVHVSPALARHYSNTAACYSGGEGSTTKCDYTVDDTAAGGLLMTASASQLGAHENVTVVMGFAKGTIQPRDSSLFASPFAIPMLVGLLIGILVFLRSLALRRGVLADKPGRPTIIAEYLPPKGYSLLTDAVLLGKPKRAAASQFIDLAVRKNLRIIEEEKTGFLAHGSDYTLEFITADGMNDDELRFARIFFGESLAAGARYTIAKNDTARSRAVYKLVSSLTSGLTSAGLKFRPKRGTTVLPSLLSVLALVVTLLSGLAVLGDARGGALPILAGIVVIVLTLISWGMLARKPLSAEGAELRDYLKGLELYIRVAEADRMRVLQSPQGAERTPVNTNDPREMIKLNERVLPYAVLFSLEKEWAAEIGKYYDDNTQPSWYSGSTAFNAAIFATSIGSLASTTASSFSGSSGSSSSGGSGGGGFSGGGGGGGGGGGV